MAKDLTPDHWFDSGTYSAANATISLTPTGLTANNASTTTGDIREVVYRFIEDFYTKYKAIGDAANASDPLPNKLTMNKSVSFNSSTGEFINTYNITVYTQALSTQVAAD